MEKDVDSAMKSKLSTRNIFFIIIILHSSRVETTEKDIHYLRSIFSFFFFSSSFLTLHFFFHTSYFPPCCTRTSSLSFFCSSITFRLILSSVILTATLLRLILKPQLRAPAQKTYLHFYISFPVQSGFLCRCSFLKCFNNRRKLYFTK